MSDHAGKAEGELTVADLKGLTALYVCGDRYWFAAPQQGVGAAAAGVETAEAVDPSGQSVTVTLGPWQGRALILGKGSGGKDGGTSADSEDGAHTPIPE